MKAAPGIAPSVVSPGRTVFNFSDQIPDLLQEGESEDLADFKKQMLALMLALHERVERSEAVQDQQDKALQVCMPRRKQAMSHHPI